MLAWAGLFANLSVSVGIRSEIKENCCEDEGDVIFHSYHLFLCWNRVIFTVLSIFYREKFSVEPAVDAILIS